MHCAIVEGVSMDPIFKIESKFILRKQIYTNFIISSHGCRMCYRGAPQRIKTLNDSSTSKADVFPKKKFKSVIITLYPNQEVSIKEL